MTLDRRQAIGVDLVVAGGVVATLKWASPGWQVITVRVPDNDVPHVATGIVFQTISEALDYLRNADRGRPPHPSGT